MLRMARHAAAIDRASATPAWPAASPSTASPTAGCCARALRAHLDPARGGRRRRRGRRGALRLAPDRAATRAPSTASRRHERRVPRAGVLRRGDRALPARRAATRTSTSTDRGAWARRIAELVADGKVVGLFLGRMEFGPRALGHRSIIGDPRSPEMQSIMNLKIKYRESFRPFAPAVLAERAADCFDLDVESPYMMLVAAGPRAPARPSNGAPPRSTTCATWVNEVRSDDPRGHPRRLLGAPPDRRPGAEPRVPRDPRPPSTSSPAARC